jgi:16S rRNA (cytidine1402-2'-O)-methyltransferase
MAGRLYVCPTPIGNLEDITLRAIRVLREVDLIVAEDTRRSHILLKRYHIKTPFARSYYQGVEEERVAGIIELLEEGKDIALISDAGTPLISDPGYPLVREAVERGIELVALPGPTALIPALIVSGFPPARFAFDGMLPRRQGRLRRYLEGLQTEPRTVIVYESPHRILKTLTVMAEVLPEREVVICRELTKLHEEVLRGPAPELLKILRERSAMKGEFVIVICGASKEQIKQKQQGQ